MQVMREVTVSPVLNGFVVRVGCQTLVFNRIEDVAANLIAYQKDPETTEQQFIKDAVNKTMEVPPPDAPPACAPLQYANQAAYGGPVDCCESSAPRIGLGR